MGLGKAIELITDEYEEYNKKLTELRDYYIKKVQENIKDVKVNGDLINRLPGNANISFNNIDGSELLFELDKVGICASAGSACSTTNPMPSHVLTAIGLNDKLANSTLRTSFGRDNSKEDIDYLVEQLSNLVNPKK